MKRQHTKWLTSHFNGFIFVFKKRNTQELFWVWANPSHNSMMPHIRFLDSGSWFLKAKEDDWPGRERVNKKKGRWDTHQLINTNTGNVLDWQLLHQKTTIFLAKWADLTSPFWGESLLTCTKTDVNVLSQDRRRTHAEPHLFQTLNRPYLKTSAASAMRRWRKGSWF